MAKRSDPDAVPGACCTWPRHEGGDVDFTSQPTWHPPALPAAVGGWRFVVSGGLDLRGKSTCEHWWWQWDPARTPAEIAAQRLAWRRLMDWLLAPTPREQGEHAP